MLKRRCGDGGNYGRAAPLTTTREREPVFITKSKTDSSPFPVRPACLAEHNIFWRNNVDAVCLGNNGPKQYPIPPRWRGHGYRPPFPRPTLRIILSFHRRKNLGRGEKARLNSRDKHFFFISPISLLISQKCIPLPLEEFSLKVIYTRDNRILFYFSSPKKSFVIFHSL